MKNFFKLLVAMIVSASVMAQAPQRFSYQAVVRGLNSELIANKQVSVRISLLQGSETGNSVYVETHNPITNTNGLLSIIIGGGKIVSGNFSSIDWSNGSYFVKSEIDLNGGSNYSISSSSQLLSVPFALYAAKGPVGPKGDKGDIGPQGINGKEGVQGPKGDKGDVGPQGFPGVNGKDGTQGPKGDTGPIGPKGDKGDEGSFPHGIVKGEMKFWNGNSWQSIVPGISNQILTFCDSLPIWTKGGVCPGKIVTLDCSKANINGILTEAKVANGVTVSISYTGGNSGPYEEQTINSTGVTGLTATLKAGNLSEGNGSLEYTISGTPVISGIASFAINIGGYSCVIGVAVNNPTSGYGSPITDEEGNSYTTVYIGTQKWMGENLKTTKYNDGTEIPFVPGNSNWGNLSTGAWTYYNNLDVKNNPQYGKLYNWYAVSTTTNGNKNVCPTGWHIPSHSEWLVLIKYLGGSTVAGGKMKEVGTNLAGAKWKSPNSQATNTSLFTGIPGGSRLSDGSYISFFTNGFWWSSTVDNNPDYAIHCDLEWDSGNAIISLGVKKNGFSVRCLED